MTKETLNLDACLHLVSPCLNYYLQTAILRTTRFEIDDDTHLSRQDQPVTCRKWIKGESRKASTIQTITLHAHRGGGQTVRTVAVQTTKIMAITKKAVLIGKSSSSSSSKNIKRKSNSCSFGHQSYLQREVRESQPSLPELLQKACHQAEEIYPQVA